MGANTISFSGFPRGLLAAMAAIGCCAGLSSTAAAEVEHLLQGWDDDQRNQFYFESQGSQLMPYAWLAALDHHAGGRFLDPETGLSRYGYLQDPRGATQPRNPDDLPIGFVKDVGTKEHSWSRRKCEFVGLSCAACHTALLTTVDSGGRERSYHIDGAPASADFQTMVSDLGRSLRKTAGDPNALEAFRARLVPNDSCEEPTPLQEQLLTRADQLSRISDPDLDPLLHPELANFPAANLPAWGPGRLDAVGTIVNQIFLHLDLPPKGLTPEEAKALNAPFRNLRPLDAPASYPFLWDTHQHNQVQWNGVSDLPTVRNIVEVLGVFADYSPKKRYRFTPWSRYESTVRVGGLQILERRMAELRSPRWSEVFGAVDDALVQNGKELWVANCQACHSDVPRDQKIPDITSRMTTLAEIGTDPNTMSNFNDRHVVGFPGVESPPGKFGDIDADLKCDSSARPVDYQSPSEQVLGEVIPQILSLSGSIIQVAPEFVRKLSLPAVDKNRCAYKGRPLDGIWATAPYFHNGSVPNLDELLKQPSDRVKRFCVSLRRRFDPNKVGIPTPTGRHGPTSCPDGQTLIDTSLTGNSNLGHHYGNLNAKERSALIEYQKTL